MKLFTYEYMYVTKDGRLIDEFFKAKANSMSGRSVISKVCQTIKEVRDRGDIFISGHFGETIDLTAV